jgi:shikimate 5-dehydrogenase
MAIKWGVIGQGIDTTRYQKLKTLIEAKGIANESILVESSADKFVTDLKELSKQVQCMRIERPFYNNVISLTVEYPLETSYLNYADSMFKKNNHWWLRSLLSEGVRRLVVKSGVKYEPTGKVLVVGTGGAARACVYGLAALGFLAIHVIDRDVKAAQDLIKGFANNLFKVELAALEPAEISSIPPQYTVVLNTTPETPENLLIKEIAFFNFIVDEAILIDLRPEASSKTFLGESKTLNVHRFGGEIVAKYCDLVWCEQAFGLNLATTDL